MASTPRGLALITGATAGIGATFARHLARQGHDLLLVARDGERLAAVSAQLQQDFGVRATHLPADLAEPAGVDAVAEAIAAQPVELLVNNAGIGLNKSFLKSTVDEELYLLNLNVIAVMRLTHTA